MNQAGIRILSDRPMPKNLNRLMLVTDQVDFCIRHLEASCKIVV